MVLAGRGFLSAREVPQAGVQVLVRRLEPTACKGAVRSEGKRAERRQRQRGPTPCAATIPVITCPMAPLQPCIIIRTILLSPSKRPQEPGNPWFLRTHRQYNQSLQNTVLLHSLSQLLLVGRLHLCQRKSQRTNLFAHQVHCSLNRNRVNLAEQLVNQRNCL